jgi:hypothetical protein
MTYVVTGTQLTTSFTPFGGCKYLIEIELTIATNEDYKL